MVKWIQTVDLLIPLTGKPDEEAAELNPGLSSNSSDGKADEKGP